MKKQKSYKGWDFLDACTSEQFNLLKEVLFIDDKKKISIDLTDGEWKQMERKVGKAEIIKALSGDGKNKDYYVYLKHVADILKISNMHSNSFVDYEDAILLACLRQLALKKPDFLKIITIWQQVLLRMLWKSWKLDLRLLQLSEYLCL